MPNNPIPQYKKNLIFRFTLEGKGIGHISKEAGVSRETVRKYQEALDLVVSNEVDRILSEKLPEEPNGEE